MSIIVDIINGAFQSILTDAVKKEGVKAYQKYKGCLGCLLVFGGVLVVFFFILLIWITASEEQEERELWNSISVGDSLFVKKNSILGIDFYKKGKTKLSDWEQRQIKYAREDTVDFSRINNVPEKYFFKRKTSFVGICIGLDSTATQSGDKWLIIKPSQDIIHSSSTQTRGFKGVQWKNPQRNYEGFKLSRDYYVKISDITPLNNDKEFK